MLAFRADIQGLRALAVGLVALDHADVGPFDGGFVGVDVFFVISGYLITALLLNEAEKKGSFSLREFYARRARRILPAAFVVIIATLIGSVFFLDGATALLTGTEAVWATFFAANVKFALDSVDYFAADAAASPLQHYWSLSVEEQFYIVWPLLLLFAGRVLVKRMGNIRQAAAVIATWIIGVSLTWSVLTTLSSPLTAYFSTPARAWELAIGALLASAAPAIANRSSDSLNGRRFLAGLSWAGLAMILIAALTYSSGTPFPGSAALLPVRGAAMLLCGGIAPALRWGPQRLLSIAPMRWVGDWSYSLYLWHWPLLIIAEYQFGDISGWSGAAVLVVATALSALTYVVVETPMRKAGVFTKPTWGRRSSLLLYPATIAMIIPAVAIADSTVRSQVGGTGDAITVADMPKPRTTRVSPVTGEPLNVNEYRALVQASVIAARNEDEIPATLDPEPLEVKDSIPDLGECDYFRESYLDIGLCPQGSEDFTKTMVVFGDSHARQWIPAFDRIADARGYRVFYMVRQGCPAVDRTPWRADGSAPNYDCAEFQDWVVEQVQTLQPELVVMATDANENGFASPEGTFIGDDETIESLMETGIEDQIERFKPHAGRVVVLEDPPVHEISPTVCLTKPDASLRDCLSPPQKRSIVMAQATRRGTVAADAEFVRTTKWFCWKGVCPTVVGDLVTHRDPEHLTVPYAEYLAPALDAAIEPLD